MTRWRCGLMACLLSAGAVLAQDAKTPGDPKAFDKAVVDSLREVHHVGRELYNTGKDFTATYRLYQGALMTVKPLLGHRPDVQKSIDAGLAAADKEPEVARKAFMLHETIEKTRGTLRTAAAETKIPETKKAEETKKPDPPMKKVEEAKKPDPPMKKPEETKKADPPVKKPEETKKPDPPAKKPEEAKAVAPMPNPKAPDDTAKKPVGGPGFRGKVTLNGKPLGKVDVVLVSLDQPKPRVFTATTQDDGQFAPTVAVPAGKYVVIVSGKGVPEKYTTTTTSPLRMEVKQPPTVFDIDLK